MSSCSRGWLFVYIDLPAKPICLILLDGIPIGSGGPSDQKDGQPGLGSLLLSCVQKF